MLVGFLSGGKKSDDAARLGAGQGQANIAVIPQPTAPAASLMPMLAEFDLELASGQEVRQVEIEGNRLVLVTGAAGGQGPASGEVIIVDLASGKVASRIGLKPASGASAGE